MAFNPVLESTIAPIERNAGPSVGGTIFGIIGDTLTAVAKSNSDEGSYKPTQSEKLAARWDEYTQMTGQRVRNENGEDMGPIRMADADNASITGFDRFAPEVSKEFRETIKMQNTPTDPYEAASQEASINAAVLKDTAWSNSPDFVIAASNAARQFPDDPNKQKAALEDARIAWDMKGRDIAAAEESLKVAKNKKEASDSLWGKVTPTLQPRVSFALGSLISLKKGLEMSPNGSFDLAKEAPEILALMPELQGFSTINRDNFEYFARQLKVGLVGWSKREFKSEGVDISDPPKEWMDSTFSVIDTIITDIDSGLTSEGLNKKYSQETILTLQEFAKANGMSMDMAIATQFPNSTAGYEAITKLTTSFKEAGPQVTSEAMSSFESQVAAAEGASINSNKQARDFFLGMITGNYTPTADKEAKDSLDAKAILGFCKNQQEVATNGGKDTEGSLSSLSVATLQACIGDKAEVITKNANTSQTFRDTIVGSLKTDLSRDISELRRATTETGLKFTIGENGEFTYDTSSVLPNKFSYYKEETIETLDKDLLKRISGKIVVLNQLGDVGKSIKEGLYEETKTTAAGGGGGGSESTSESIGAKLGIDFETLEAENGLPAGFLERTAYLESRGNPKAANPDSSAEGLFQQTDGNAKQYGVKDKFDPVQSTDGAVDFAVDNNRILTRALGRKPTGAELYLAHQQGGTGAARLLSNPTALASDVVGADAVRLNGGDLSMTAGQFANLWLDKYNNAPTVNTTTGTPANANSVAANAGPAGQRAVGNFKAPDAGLEFTGGTVSSPVTTTVAPTAEMPQEAPKEAPVEGKAPVGEVAVTDAGKALLQALGGSADREFETVEEMNAATDLSPGEVVQVGGEVYVVRKDGTKQKVGG